MHDLLHSFTSCHFKICLKSHTTGTTAHRDLTAAFSDGHYAGDRSLYNSLPFSGGAHGTGGLSVISLLQILELCDRSDSDIISALPRSERTMSKQQRMTSSA